MTREQRLHREADPRVGRSLGRTAVCAVVLVIMALAVVAVRIQQVRLTYQLDSLRAERGRVGHRPVRRAAGDAALSAPPRGPGAPARADGARAAAGGECPRVHRGLRGSGGRSGGADRGSGALIPGGLRTRVLILAVLLAGGFLGLA